MEGVIEISDSHFLDPVTLPGRKSSRKPLNGMLVGTHNRSGRIMEGIRLLPLPP
jgi:hypothetical protein